MDSHEIITRKEAIERGLKRYFTGKTCKNGHLEQREIISCTCLGCHKTNDKVKQSNKRSVKKFQTEKRDKYLSYMSDWGKKNNDKSRLRMLETRHYERALKHAEQDPA